MVIVFNNQFLFIKLSIIIRLEMSFWSTIASHLLCGCVLRLCFMVVQIEILHYKCPLHYNIFLLSSASHQMIYVRVILV